jgi:NADH-quinone oxidoreductase subunit E
MSPYQALDHCLPRENHHEWQWPAMENERSSEELDQRLRTILANYDRTDRSALISLLQQVQGELGYIPEEAIFAIGEVLDVPAAEVFGTLSFYAQFRLAPIGRNLVTLCRGTACHVRGAPRVRQTTERLLGISAGETTPDSEYTLETVACIGACALAPTMVLNGRTYGLMTSHKAEEMFGDYYQGRTRAPEGNTHG